MTEKMLMEEMSWREIEDGQGHGHLGCGAIEQHEPHLPIEITVEEILKNGE